MARIVITKICIKKQLLIALAFFSIAATSLVRAEPQGFGFYENRLEGDMQENNIPEKKERRSSRNRNRKRNKRKNSEHSYAQEESTQGSLKTPMEEENLRPEEPSEYVSTLDM